MFSVFWCRISSAVRGVLGGLLENEIKKKDALPPSNAINFHLKRVQAWLPNSISFPL